MRWEVTQTLSSRGRRSRNKVSVGEPAEGSLPNIHIPTVLTVLVHWVGLFVSRLISLVCWFFLGSILSFKGKSAKRSKHPWERETREAAHFTLTPTRCTSPACVARALLRRARGPLAAACSGCPCAERGLLCLLHGNNRPLFAHTNTTKDNSQQRMSWLSQR